MGTARKTRTKDRSKTEQKRSSRQTTLPQSENTQLGELMRQFAAQQQEMQSLRQQLAAGFAGAAAVPAPHPVVKVEAGATGSTPGDAGGIFHTTKEAPQHLVKSLQRSTNLICANNLKSGAWDFGCTISTLDEDSRDEAIEAIRTATPGFSYECVREYIKNRLTYMKCQTNTLGRWKLKTTKEFPRGFFQRFDGPARGVRVAADGTGELPDKKVTETVLNYFDAGQPTEGPLYDAFWALEGVQYVRPTDVKPANLGKPAAGLDRDQGEK
eukprot:gene31457-39567_t